MKSESLIDIPKQEDEHSNTWPFHMGVLAIPLGTTHWKKYNVTTLLLHWMRLYFSSVKKDQSYLSITFAMYGKWSSILCSFSSSASSSFSNSPVAYNSLLTEKRNLHLVSGYIHDHKHPRHQQALKDLCSPSVSTERLYNGVWYCVKLVIAQPGRYMWWDGPRINIRFL